MEMTRAKDSAISTFSANLDLSIAVSNGRTELGGAPKSFLFIDGRSSNSSDAKRVRSHAAMGRNKGRGRPRILRQLVSDAEMASAMLFLQEPDRSSDLLPTFVGLQYDLDARSKIIFAQLLDLVRFDIHDGPWRGILHFDLLAHFWTQLFFQDEAYLHCMAALLNVSFGGKLLDGLDSHDAIWHLTRGVGLVGSKLSVTVMATAATTFAAVIAIVHYHRFSGDYKSGAVHLNGLLQMVDLYGGLQRFACSFPAMVEKIYRADIEFALQLGAPTRITSADMPWQGRLGLINTNAAHVPYLRGLPTASKGLFALIWKLSATLDRAAAEHITINGNIYRDAVIYATYRMMELCPVPSLPLATEGLQLRYLGMWMCVLQLLDVVGWHIRPLPKLIEEAESTLLRLRQPDSDSLRLATWLALLCQKVTTDIIDSQWIDEALQGFLVQLQITNVGHLRQVLGDLPCTHTLLMDVCPMPLPTQELIVASQPSLITTTTKSGHPVALSSVK